MKTARLSSLVGLGIMGASIVALCGADAAELPVGPNREIVSRECQACHDLEMVFDAAGATRDDWNGALEQMTSYGLHVSPEDRAKILDYLATYLGPGSKVKAR
jgi:hypothetical protein